MALKESLAISVVKKKRLFESRENELSLRIRQSKSIVARDDVSTITEIWKNRSRKVTPAMKQQWFQKDLAIQRMKTADKDKNIGKEETVKSMIRTGNKKIQHTA